jgi:hypothetical protein
MQDAVDVGDELAFVVERDGGVQFQVHPLARGAAVR